VASSKTPYEESILGTNLWWLKAVVRFVMAMVMFSAISIGVNLVYNKYVWATGTGPDHLESMIGFALDHRKRSINDVYQQVLQSRMMVST
jgi:hypothetical protein